MNAATFLNEKISNFKSYLISISDPSKHKLIENYSKYLGLMILKFDASTIDKHKQTIINKLDLKLNNEQDKKLQEYLLMFSEIKLKFSQ